MTPSIVFWQLRLRNFDECISHTQRLKFIFFANASRGTKGTEKDSQFVP